MSRIIDFVSSHKLGIRHTCSPVSIGSMSAAALLANATWLGFCLVDTACGGEKQSSVTLSSEESHEEGTSWVLKRHWATCVYLSRSHENTGVGKCNTMQLEEKQIKCKQCDMLVILRSTWGGHILNCTNVPGQHVSIAVLTVRQQLPDPGIQMTRQGWHTALLCTFRSHGFALAAWLNSYTRQVVSFSV